MTQVKKNLMAVAASSAMVFVFHGCDEKTEDVQTHGNSKDVPNLDTIVGGSDIGKAFCNFKRELLSKMFKGDVGQDCNLLQSNEAMQKMIKDDKDTGVLAWPIELQYIEFKNELDTHAQIKLEGGREHLYLHKQHIYSGTRILERRAVEIALTQITENNVNGESALKPFAVEKLDAIQKLYNKKKATPLAEIAADDTWLSQRVNQDAIIKLYNEFWKNRPVLLKQEAEKQLEIDQDKVYYYNAILSMIRDTINTNDAFWVNNKEWLSKQYLTAMDPMGTLGHKTYLQTPEEIEKATQQAEKNGLSWGDAGKKMKAAEDKKTEIYGRTKTQVYEEMKALPDFWHVTKDQAGNWRFHMGQHVCIIRYEQWFEKDGNNPSAQWLNLLPADVKAKRPKKAQADQMIKTKMQFYKQLEIDMPEVLKGGEAKGTYKKGELDEELVYYIQTRTHYSAHRAAKELRKPKLAAADRKNNTTLLIDAYKKYLKDKETKNFQKLLDTEKDKMKDYLKNYTYYNQMLERVIHNKERRAEFFKDPDNLKKFKLILSKQRGVHINTLKDSELCAMDATQDDFLKLATKDLDDNVDHTGKNMLELSALLSKFIHEFLIDAAAAHEGKKIQAELDAEAEMKLAARKEKEWKEQKAKADRQEKQAKANRAASRHRQGLAPEPK